MLHFRSKTIIHVLSASFLLAGSIPAAEFTVQERDNQIDVEIDGQPFTTYRQEDLPKPILYPLLGPQGIPMTRNWPLKKDVPGEAKDHVHHKSMWYAHSPVNGVDFWSESTRSGRVVQTKLVRAEGGKDRAVIETTNDWKDAKGKVQLTDTRLLTFSQVPGGRAIDWQLTFHASHGPVTFGDSKEGSMAIRTRPELQLENNPKQGVTTAKGQALNSEGVRGKDVWAKRAKWVDYWAEVEGKILGVAIFDHPQNPRHPTWWHAREYGLISANPFGIHDFEKGQPAGAGNLAIPAGKSVTFRYRFVFHEGDPQKAKIAELYERFAMPGK
ncbi:MAG: PmoA family protein [Pirellulales bacterium]|nr:PmoA family protein [Pirellulales bacterium]